MVTVRPYFSKRERRQITAAIPASDRQARERVLEDERKRRRPGCKHWEADLSFCWPDGAKFRRRLRVPHGCGEANARRWAEERERAFVRGGKPAAPPPPRPIVPTLAEFAPTFVDASRALVQKASTTEAKASILRTHLVAALGGKCLDAIDAAAIAALTSALLARKLTAKTRNNVLTVLRGVLKLAREHGHIATLPEIRLARVKTPEMKRYSDEEYARLLDAAASVDGQAHLAIVLAGDAGLRLGEIVSLRWSAVDLARGTITVALNSWRGIEDAPKGGRSHALPLTARLAAALTSAPRRGARVIERDGRPVNARHVGLLMKRATALAGLAPTEGIHRLRHTFCSRLADAGASPEAIRRLARHTTMAVTQRYLHATDATLAQAVALLNR
jgi:integrase